MSINSLINFGVPGPNGERTPILQPMLSDRFRVIFYNFGDIGSTGPYDMTRAIKSCGQPSPTFGTWNVWSYMSQHKGVTRPEWADIEVAMSDDIDNQAQRRIQQQLGKQFNFFDQTASRAGENYMFEMDIDILSGGASAGFTAADPVVLRKWSLVGCSITTAKQGDLAYENSEAMTTNFTVMFNNASCFDGNGSLLGSFDHGPEHDSQSGISSLGVGGASAIRS